MSKLSLFIENLLNNSTVILTALTGIMGFCITLNSVIVVCKKNLIKNYKNYRNKILSLEKLSNKNKIKLYQNKSFLKLKNQGKDPCKMEEKIKIDDFYLSDFSTMYIDLNREIY